MTSTGSYPRLDAVCRETVAAKAFASSLLVAARSGQGRHSCVFGDDLDHEVEPDALCELHCLTKPMVAWALLEVASLHGLDPRVPVRRVMEGADHLDDAVTVAGICNHLTRIAQPSALDWVTRPPGQRPAVGDLRQEASGSWYSEVGSWVVAAELIATISGRSAVDLVADLIDRCGADAYIGMPLPAGRRVVVPIAGLPRRRIPMLHVEHPTYQGRLGPEFGGFGSMIGYVRFLDEVGRAIRREPSAIAVADEVLDAVLSSEHLMAQNLTWHRPARFLGGFLDAETPHEPGLAGMLLMFAGIGSTACLIDPAGNRELAFYSDVASFDAADHGFLRRLLIGAFLDDTGQRS